MIFDSNKKVIQNGVKIRKVLDEMKETDRLVATSLWDVPDDYGLGVHPLKDATATIHWRTPYEENQRNY